MLRGRSSCGRLDSRGRVSLRGFVARLLNDRGGDYFVQTGMREWGCGTGSDHAVASGSFGFAESFVGEFEKKVNLIGGFVEGGDAN